MANEKKQKTTTHKQKRGSKGDNYRETNKVERDEENDVDGYVGRMGVDWSSVTN